MHARLNTPLPSLHHTARVFAHLARWPRPCWKWLLGCSQTGLLDIRRRRRLPVGLFQSADDTVLESRRTHAKKGALVEASVEFTAQTPQMLELRRRDRQEPPPPAHSCCLDLKCLNYRANFGKRDINSKNTVTDLYCNSIWQYNLRKFWGGGGGGTALTINKQSQWKWRQLTYWEPPAAGVSIGSQVLVYSWSAGIFVSEWLSQIHSADWINCLLIDVETAAPPP